MEVDTRMTYTAVRIFASSTSSVACRVLYIIVNILIYLESGHTDHFPMRERRGKGQVVCDLSPDSERSSTNSQN